MTCCMLMTGVSSPALLSSLGAFEILVLAMAVPVSVALFFFADKFVNRIVVFALAVFLIYGAEKWWSSGDQPGPATSQGVVPVNEARNDVAAPLAFLQGWNTADIGAGGAVLVAAGLCFGRYLRSGLGKLQKVQLAA